MGSFSGYEHDVFFVRGKDGRYIEAGYLAGLDADHDGRAAAAIDVDGDGDLDLARLSLQGLGLMLNEGQAGGWVRLRLRATGSEAHALGALVKVGDQVQRVALTAGFHTQVSPELHFGLGLAKTAKVEVRWPSGGVERFEVKSKHRYAVVEGAEARQLLPTPRWSKALAPAARSFDLSTVQGAKGRATVLNFWAPWCEACARELPALARLHRERGTQVDFIGVSVETKKLDEVEAFVKRFGLRYPMKMATDGIVEAFFGARGEMSLPATFVFDARGRLARTFFREVRAEELAATLDGLQVSASAQDHLGMAVSRSKAGDFEAADEAFAQAIAMGGEGALVYWQIGVTALQAKRSAAAVVALRRAVKLNPEDAEAWTDLARAHRDQGAGPASERALRTAIALGHAPRAHHFLGEALLKRGAAAEAAASLKRALEQDPSQLLSWKTLARAQAAQGLREDAEDSMQRYREASK